MQSYDYDKLILPEGLTKEKKLREFLMHLIELNKANIDFMDGKEIYFIRDEKYSVELEKIKEVINSFNLS